MKRIHVWTQSYDANPGGIQTFTRFVVRGLADLYPDAEICVFAKNDLGQFDAGKIDRGGAVNSTRGACAPQIVGFGRWPRPLRAIAFAVGVIWRAVWIPRRRDDVPTIIVSTHVNFAPVAALLNRFIGKVPFCAIGHGIEVWEIEKAPLRNALRVADQLVAVSEFTRARMAQALQIDANRIEVLPNTFDAEKFKPRPKSQALLQRYALQEEEPVILTVARLAETEQYKGYDNVMLAFPEILNRHPAARYILVGDGPDRPRIEALARRLKIAGNVTFAGYVPNEELGDFYNLCDLFVMPSKGEGFGIVFLEALSCGKPVIAGNKDASSEAVLQGKLGVLVDPDSVADIANAICRVLAELGSTLNEEKSAAGTSATHEATAWQAAATADGERRRREVIAAFGFEQFRRRLGEIVQELEDGS